MDWVEVSVVFFISHLVGDFLVQTDWQARHKHGGLGRDPVNRRALVAHVCTYTLCFVPALVWIGGQQGVAEAFGIGVLIAIPHAAIDDARLLLAYMERVKGSTSRDLAFYVDQSMHLICLSATALLAAQ